MVLIELKTADEDKTNQQSCWNTRAVIAAIFGAIGTASLILLALISPPAPRNEDE